MEKQTAGRDRLGEFAPQFAALNDDVLFGEVWAKEDVLTTKQRCMITVAGFIGKGMVDSAFAYHIANAKKHGVTKQEMAEMITHLAFYCGWPNAWAAFNLAKEVYAEDETEETHGGMFGLGEFNKDYAQYFIGNSYLKPLAKTATDTKDLTIMNVTFEPRCRNNWHIHNATKGGGQILVCVDGEGWYQEEGKEPRSLKPGDVVTIPANVKHWHGAKATNWFSHLAIEVPGENASNTWCEPVTDEEYDNLV